MTQALAVDEGYLWLAFDKVREQRPANPDAIDQGRQQPAKLRPIVAGEPPDVPDKFVPVLGLEEPEDQASPSAAAEGSPPRSSQSGNARLREYPAPVHENPLARVRLLSKFSSIRALAPLRGRDPRLFRSTPTSSVRLAITDFSQQIDAAEVFFKRLPIGGALVLLSECLRRRR